MSVRTPLRQHARSEGMALVTVLFFVLLLVTGIATFQQRATVDVLSAHNRDRAAQAEALARGGVQLALTVLLEDRLLEEEGERVETREDPWVLLGNAPLQVADGGVLEVKIEDAGSRLNLNALFANGSVRDPLSETFLAAFFEKVIAEVALPEDQEEPPYDALELARHLVDWVDTDTDSLSGGLEDDYYQQQDPPYRAPNRPLLSVEEIALIEGFDALLLDALRPYVGVHPIAGGEGINPNTAPSFVLATLYHGSGSDYQLASQETVRSILDARTSGALLCAEENAHPDCTPLANALGGDVYPPATLTSDVFLVTATAAYGDVRRSIEAVLDRSNVTEPRILAWKVR